MMLDMNYVHVHGDTTTEQIESDVNQNPPQFRAEIYHHAEGYECHQDGGTRGDDEHCTSAYPRCGLNRMSEEWSIIDRDTDEDQGPSGQEGVEENQLAGLSLDNHYLEIAGYGAFPVFEISKPSPVIDHQIWLAAGLYDVSVPGSPLHDDSESPTSMLVNLSDSDRSLEHSDYFTRGPCGYFNRTPSPTALVRHVGVALAPPGYHFIRSPLPLLDEPRRSPAAVQTLYPRRLELSKGSDEEADA